MTVDRESAPSALPADLRTELLSVVGDLRLFERAWPEDLLLRFMVAILPVQPYDANLHDRMLVATLALFPKHPAEELPEGLTEEQLCKMGSLMLDGIYKALEGTQPLKPT